MSGDLLLNVASAAQLFHTSDGAAFGDCAFASIVDLMIELNLS